MSSFKCKKEKKSKTKQTKQNNKPTVTRGITHIINLKLKYFTHP